VKLAWNLNQTEPELVVEYEQNLTPEVDTADNWHNISQQLLQHIVVNSST